MKFRGCWGGGGIRGKYLQSKHLSAWKTRNACGQVAVALVPSSGTPLPFFSHFPSFDSCDLADLPISFSKSSFQESLVGSKSCRCCGVWPEPGDGRGTGSREAGGCRWFCFLVNQNDGTESQQRLCWKRPLRSRSPTFNPALPGHH